MVQAKPEHKDNYRIMEDQNRKHFLAFDQEKFIRKFDLAHDETYIYFNMLGKKTVLERSTGYIAWNGEKADVNCSLSVYDMLCHSEKRPVLAEKWASISDLGGIIGTKHDSSLSNAENQIFAGKTEQLKAACRDLGGKEESHADVSFILPVFDFFPVWFRFWDADEEFPANVSFLFDANALDFMYYEHLWYLMGFIREQLEKRIR